MSLRYTQRVSNYNGDEPPATLPPRPAGTSLQQEVTALAVHPYQDIVVSGQAGKEAIVCLFDASHRPEVGRRERKRDHDAQLAEGDLGGYAAGADGAGTPFFLRELSLGKKERRGVRDSVTFLRWHSIITWLDMCLGLYSLYAPSPPDHALGAPKLLV